VICRLLTAQPLLVTQQTSADLPRILVCLQNIADLLHVSVKAACMVKGELMATKRVRFVSWQRRLVWSRSSL
jgi:hypothetical protein